MYTAEQINSASFNELEKMEREVGEARYDFIDIHQKAIEDVKAADDAWMSATKRADMAYEKAQELFDIQQHIINMMRARIGGGDDE